MKKTVSIYDFRDAFLANGRATQFSYEGLQVLFDYLEDYEADTGEELELDVVALCCDYVEASWQDVAGAYDIDLSEASEGMCEASAYGLEQIEKAKKQLVIDYLTEHTIICGESVNGFVYGNF